MNTNTLAPAAGRRALYIGVAPNRNHLSALSDLTAHETPKAEHTSQGRVQGLTPSLDSSPEGTRNLTVLALPTANATSRTNQCTRSALAPPSS
jgi:hypothetical protein